MKVKRLREDFQVREASRLQLGSGPFSVYRLEKSGIGTPEALHEIAQQWELKRNDLSHGGLKDRHAVTEQLITIFDGPQRTLEAEQFSLSYVGQTTHAMSAKAIVGNDFRIVLRALPETTGIELQQLFERQSLWVPNYFDHQRFGSLGQSGTFAAQPWCLGDYEKALRIALTDICKADNATVREDKTIVAENWGEWQFCKDRIERGNRRSVITYLVDHPTKFKKALALIHRDQRSFYVSAFQSAIWNLAVSRWIGEQLHDTESQKLHVDSPVGRLALPPLAHASLTDELKEIRLPLPSGRSPAWPEPMRDSLAQTVADFGLKMHQLRLSFPRDVFFARAQRPMWLRHESKSSLIEPDELSTSDLSKLTLEFRLPPGHYATMLLRVLEAAVGRSFD